MNSETSRRSACDRCRGQKLRCVRPSRPDVDSWEDASNPTDQQMETCGRCIKAGATCINTLTSQRKVPRTERLEPLSSSSSTSPSERLPSQHFLPTNSNPFQHGGGVDPGPSTISEGKFKDSSFKSSETIAIQQLRTNFQGPLEERPSKRRSIERPPGSPTLYQHLGSINVGSTSVSDSLSRCPADTQTLSADGDTGSGPNKSFMVDSFDFVMRLSPEFNAHHDKHDNLMNFLFTPGQENLTEPTFTSNMMAENNLKTSEGPVIQPMDTQEDCLNRLSELSSRLLKDFSRTNSAKLSEILFFSPMATKNTIGRVLESSQVFLEILQFLKESSCNSDPTLYAESEYSYSEDWDDSAFTSGVSTINNSSYDQNSVVIAVGDGTHSSTGGASRALASSPSVTVDMPTTLMILTCYTWLLQTYDTIFSRIYISLSAQCKTSSHSMPFILPGLHIGGFDLDDHKDLQMEILIQVSSKRLERIEEMLGIRVISQAHDNMNNTRDEKGILDATSASALLDIIFKQNEFESSKEGQGRAALVKQTMDNIQGILSEKRS